MNEKDKTNKADVQAITTEQFAKYLNTKKVSSICNGCGHDPMSILNSLDNTPMIASMLHGVSIGQVVRFYLTQCPQCGYTRNYVANFVEKEIAKL